MRLLRIALAALLIAPAAAAAQEAGSPDALADIVVTAPPGPPRLEPDTAAWFRTLCFDPMRRTGAPAMPPEGEGWVPLAAAGRRALGVGGRDAPAYGLASPAKGRTLLFKAEGFDRPTRLRETRCTLVVIGGAEHERLAADISALFGGGPTERHVGEDHGARAVPGWRQRLWSAMPRRGSPAWRAINAGRGARDTWLVVTHRNYYRGSDYVLAELKTSQQPGRRVSVLALYLTTAGRPAGR